MWSFLLPFFIVLYSFTPFLINVHRLNVHRRRETWHWYNKWLYFSKFIHDQNILFLSKIEDESRRERRIDIVRLQYRRSVFDFTVEYHPCIHQLPSGFYELIISDLRIKLRHLQILRRTFFDSPQACFRRKAKLCLLL